MPFTELTTKDLLAQTRGFIREVEAKIHSHGLQAAMNERLKAHYTGQKPPNKNGAENAKQQAAKDALVKRELEISLPALLDHLAELQAQDDKEEAEREAAAPAEPADDASEPAEEPAKRNGRVALVPASRDA